MGCQVAPGIDLPSLRSISALVFGLCVPVLETYMIGY